MRKGTYGREKPASKQSEHHIRDRRLSLLKD